ncbi:MAG: helix-hairpin-helix domain-containing protein, partial [Phycisphaerae bacterium]
ESERAFCQMMTKVKGVSLRKALRAFAVPLPEIAAAIERGDERFLAALPELGKKTAATIVAELKGKLALLAGAERGAAEQAPRQLSDAQQVALEILVQWGERPFDAQRWITEAVEADATLEQPDAIVKAVYRIKQTVRA